MLIFISVNKTTPSDKIEKAVTKHNGIRTKENLDEYNEIKEENDFIRKQFENNLYGLGYHSSRFLFGEEVWQKLDELLESYKYLYFGDFKN